MLLFSCDRRYALDLRRRPLGKVGATLAATAWVLQPNLFANGHYATVDATLASLWLLALIAFAEAVLPRFPRRRAVAQAPVGVGHPVRIDCRPGRRLQVDGVVPPRFRSSSGAPSSGVAAAC